jgi:hypothetical protein
VANSQAQHDQQSIDSSDNSYDDVSLNITQSQLNNKRHSTKGRNKAGKTSKQGQAKKTSEQANNNKIAHKNAIKKSKRIVEFDATGCGVYFFPSTGRRTKCSRFSTNKKLPKSDEQHDQSNFEDELNKKCTAGNNHSLS